VPTLTGQVITTNNHTLPSHPRLCSLSVASYDSQGLRWKNSNPTPHGDVSPLRVYEVEVEVNLGPTFSRSVCLVVGLPSGAHDQIFVFLMTIVGFLMCGTLSDERMGL
jgi:hypothetical protein